MLKIIKHSIFILSCIILSAGGVTVQGQTVKQLESQRKQALKNLETTNKMLNETKQSQKSTVNKLTIIDKSIKERTRLINSIGVEVNAIDKQILLLEKQKTELEKKLEYTKADYAKLVQENNVNRNAFSNTMFILSAESFDQSYRRMRYLQEYAGYRKEQATEIGKLKTAIELKNDSLAQYKKSKITVISQKEIETKKLAVDKEKEKQVYDELQKKETKLRADLEVQQKKAEELDKKIEKLIAEQIRKAEEKKKAQDKKAQDKKTETAKKDDKKTTKPEKETPSTTTDEQTSVLTKEEKLLAGNFEKNLGRLPWPVQQGFISGRYGVQPHPVLKYVTTNNKGIYLQTPVNSIARAVFEGVVTQRFSIPGNNNAVIIQHGSYRTVYANLTEIYVKEGDKISAKQDIGKIYTDDEKDNKTELYFQVWKGKLLQNPERWLAK